MLVRMSETQVSHHFSRPSSNSVKISVYHVTCSFTPVILPDFTSSALLCFYETSSCYWLSIPGIDWGHCAFCLYDALFYSVSSLKWTNLLSISIVEIYNARIEINSRGKQFNKHYREIHYRCYLYWKDACLKMGKFYWHKFERGNYLKLTCQKYFFLKKVNILFKGFIIIVQHNATDYLLSRWKTNISRKTSLGKKCP